MAVALEEFEDVRIRAKPIDQARVGLRPQFERFHVPLVRPTGPGGPGQDTGNADEDQREEEAVRSHRGVPLAPITDGRGRRLTPRERGVASRASRADGPEPDSRRPPNGSSPTG